MWSKLEISMFRRIIDTEELNKLKEAVAKVSRIVITCHKKADGDAIGSSLAMKLWQAIL